MHREKVDSGLHSMHSIEEGALLLGIGMEQFRRDAKEVGIRPIHARLRQGFSGGAYKRHLYTSDQIQQIQKFREERAAKIEKHGRHYVKADSVRGIRKQLLTDHEAAQQALKAPQSVALQSGPVTKMVGTEVFEVLCMHCWHSQPNGTERCCNPTCQQVRRGMRHEARNTVVLK